MASSQSEGMRVDSDKPNIRAVRADKDRRLVIRWRGGAESVVDVSQHIAEYAIFVPLRSDHDAFRKAKSVSGAGACIGRTIRRFPLTPSGVSPLNRERVATDGGRRIRLPRL